MTTRDGHRRNGLVTQLVGDLTQLIFRHAPQIIRRRHAIKQRSLRGLRHAPSPVMLDLRPRRLSSGSNRAGSKPLLFNRLTPDGSTGANARYPTWLPRQRNELRIASNHGEPALLPIGFGLLDALLTRRDEVPPNIARAVHCGTPHDDKMRVGDRFDGDAVTGAEHQQPPRRE